MEHSGDAPDDPAFFSWRFHTRFFPRVLRQNLWRFDKRNSPFAPHVRLELVFALVGSLVLLCAAAPFATQGSRVALGLAGLGAAGTIALVAQRAWERRTTPVTFDGFSVAPFVACVLLGSVTALVLATATNAVGFAVAAYVVPGAIIGYVTGIGAGLYVQRLGWMAGVFKVFAMAMSFGLILVGAVILM
jgi:hypothetical protein